MDIESTALLEQLLATYRLIRTQIEDLADAKQLSVSQVLAIRRLAERPGAPMRELGRELRLTGGAVTSLVDQLERRGLLRRAAGRDRRVTHLFLTPEGIVFDRSLRQELRRQLGAWLAAMEPEKAQSLDSGLEALLKVSRGANGRI